MFHLAFAYTETIRESQTPQKRNEKRKGFDSLFDFAQRSRLALPGTPNCPPQLSALSGPLLAVAAEHGASALDGGKTAVVPSRAVAKHRGKRDIESVPCGVVPLQKSAPSTECGRSPVRESGESASNPCVLQGWVKTWTGAF